MKLNLTQYNPQEAVNVPNSTGFHFLRDLERNMKECFSELRDCDLGLPSAIEDDELPRFLANRYERLHIKEHFEDGEREAAKRKMGERCGCHVNADGFVQYSHYYVCYRPKWIKEKQLEAEREASKKQFVRSNEENDDKLSEKFGRKVQSRLEKYEQLLSAISWQD